MPSYASCTAANIDPCLTKNQPTPAPGATLCTIIQDATETAAKCQSKVGGAACLQIARTQCDVQLQLEKNTASCDLDCSDASLPGVGSGGSGTAVFVVIVIAIATLVGVGFYLRRRRLQEGGEPWRFPAWLQRCMPVRTALPTSGTTATVKTPLTGA